MYEPKDSPHCHLFQFCDGYRYADREEILMVSLLAGGGDYQHRCLLYEEMRCVVKNKILIKLIRGVWSSLNQLPPPLH